MNKMTKTFLYILTFLLGGHFLFAQELPPAPHLLVSDQVELLTQQQKNYLEKKLVTFNDTTSTQIAVFITDGLQGYDIADFSQRVAHQWGVGQTGKDNGVLIVLVPKTATSRGDVNIEIGYGLEPIIPDITAKRIIENEMIPRFQSEDYFGGLDAATDVIISLAAGHFSADEYSNNNGAGGAGLFIPILVLFIVISLIRRNKRGVYSAGQSNLPFWTALWLGSTMGRGHGGSWGNFNSGSGGFGGGGGGFGGFGGGGFGGGGASGSW